MITEDYVSFEVAKMLKEKGFNENCYASYNGNGKLYKFDEEVDDNTPYWSNAPTLQMAMKWLREVHNIFICINMVGNGDDSYVLFTYNIYQNKNYKLIFGSNIPKYNSYEEAVEEALKYCLENLI